MKKIIKRDCRHFIGSIPCKPHKLRNVKCPCPEYERTSERILIIKLGAIGDVIRSTPIVRKIKKVYPYAEISWLTYFPEFVPKKVDNILNFELKNIVWLVGNEFDVIYNLDKDNEAISLAKMLRAEKKKGFGMQNGKCYPLDKDAEHKYLTGLDDELNKKNKKSYLEEIFEICGFKFSGEKYILEKREADIKFPKLKKPVVGLNTGAGKRWTTRLWPESYWMELAKILKKRNMTPILLGGLQEHKKNQRIAKKSGAKYLGTFSLDNFVNLMDKCDVIVTAVSMALHIAIGLEKRIILFNNIFNKNEFELFGLGEIIQPDISCLGCFKNTCEKDCMKKITPMQVYKSIAMQLNLR